MRKEQIMKNISIAGKIEDTEDQIIETIEDNAVFYDSRG